MYYRLLTPILAFVVAFTLFFTFVQPTFNEYKRIDTEIGDYEQALSSARLLQERVNELISQRAAIPQSAIERLMKVLPDSIDEVGVVLTLDDLATKNEMALGEINVKSSRGGSKSTQDAPKDSGMFTDEQEGKKVQSDGTIVKTTADYLDTTILSFSVTGPYENFKKLIAELEDSVTLMDISALSIEQPQEGKSDFITYTVSVTMYQFKKPTD